LTRADGAQNPKSGLPRDVKRTCIKKSNKEEKDTLRHQGGVQHACTPKTWSRGTGPYFGYPTLCQLTNQRRRLGGRTGCRSLEKSGYDTLERVEQHAMTDVKGVPLASHDMHVRLQIYWISLHCLMPRLAQEDQIPLAAAASGCETNRLPRGTAWQPRLFKDVFMRVPVRLELLEEGLCSG
jgi:hypothetical protein